MIDETQDPLSQDPSRPPTPMLGPMTPAPQGPKPQSDFAAWMDAKIADDNRTLKTVYAAALRSDPKVEAEASALAAKLGVPRDRLPDNLDIARQLVKERQVNHFYTNLQDPGLRERFSDVRMVRHITDDLGNVQRVAGWFDWWTRNKEAGEGVNELGYLKAKRAFLRSAGGSLTPSELDRVAELEDIERAAEVESGFFEEASKLVGQFITPTLRSVAAGAAAAGATALVNPAAAAGVFSAATTTSLFAHSALVEFGHEYDSIYQQLIDANVPPDEAHKVAMTTGGAYALAAGAIEVLGIGTEGAGKILGKKLLGLARPTAKVATAEFIKKVGLGILGETGEEGAQEILGAVAERIAGSLTKTDSGPTFEDTLARVGDVMLRTAKGLAVISPVMPAMHYAADVSRVREAKRAQEFFTGIAEAAKDSTVLPRNPQVFAQVVAARASGSDLENVYIAPKALTEGLASAKMTRQQLAYDLPDVAAQLDKAEREQTDNDIVIPMGDFAAKIANSELLGAIQPSLRFKNGFTLEQADEWLAEQSKNREETAKLIAEAAGKNLAWNAEAEAVQQRIAGEVQKDTRLSKDSVKQYALLHRLHVEAMAAREGVSPKVWDEANPLRINVKTQQSQTTGGRLASDVQTSETTDDTGRRLRIVGRPDDARYGTPITGADSVLGIHLSHSPRSSLSGEAYGTGLRGGERARVAGDPILSKRVHFYVDTGKGVEPEPGLGNALHTVQLDNVYNTDKDALGLVAAWRAAKASGQSTSFNDLENAIVAAGFDGIYVPRAQEDQGVAVLLGPKHTNVPVTSRSNPLTARRLYQDAPGLYSALQKALEELDVVRDTAEGWKKRIQKLVDDGIVKQEEVFWSSLDDFLDGEIEARRLTPYTYVDEKGQQTLLSEKEALQLLSEKDDAAEALSTNTYFLEKSDLTDWMDNNIVQVTEAGMEAQPADKGYALYQGSQLVGEFSSEHDAYDEMSRSIEYQVDDDMRGLHVEIEPPQPLDDQEKFLSSSPLIPTREEWWQKLGTTAASFNDAIAKGILRQKAVGNRGLTDDSVEGMRLHFDTLIAEGPEWERNDAIERLDTVYQNYVQDWKDAQERAAYLQQLNGRNPYILYVDLSRVSSLGTTDTEKFLAAFNEKEFDTVDDAEAAKADLREQLRERVTENISEDFYVDDEHTIDNGNTDGRRFEHYISGGEGSPHSGYGEVAIVLEDKASRQEEDNPVPTQHAFDAEPRQASPNKNRLAHYRFTLRDVVGHGESLFIDEIQSDWADSVREAGSYMTEQEFLQKRDALIEESKKANERVKSLPAGSDIAEFFDLRDTADRLQAKAQAFASNAVPLGPFVHSTDAWVSLALKQIFIRAVASGRDSVVFTTGPQAARAYPRLAKFIKTVQWDRVAGTGRTDVRLTGPSGEFLLQVTKDGTVVSSSIAKLQYKPLSAALGKEFAQRILSSDDNGSFDIPADYDVGSLGMRSFYGNGQGFQTDGKGEVIKNDSGQPVPAIVPKLIKELFGKDVEFSEVKVDGLKDKNLMVTLSDEAQDQIRQGFTLFQTEGREARGEFDPATNEIFLNPKANASTLLHEMSHFWLSTLFKTASASTASLQTRKDAQTVLGWFGVANLAEWDRLSFAEQSKHHEAWAYNAEAHFFGEGKAPSTDPAVIRMFRAFKRWVRSVYRQVRETLNANYKARFGVDLPALTDDVRAVFDRMIASEDAIAAAKAQEAAAPMLREKPADMAEEDWKSYLDDQQEADDKAIEELEQSSLRTLRWLGDNEAKLAKRIQRSTRALRKRIEAEERTKLEAEPAYRARQILKHGTIDDNGVERPFKLSIHGFRESPYASDEREKALGYGRSGMLSNDGLHPDAAAPLLGFETGDDLVRALIFTPPLDEAVTQKADARMLAEHSDLLDPEKVKLMIEKALHGEARARMVAAELRWLSKVTAPVRTMLKAAREHAREIIANTKIGLVRPHDHALAETRNRRDAERALIRGDHKAAASFKRRELIESQLEREALAVREQIEATAKLVKQLFRPDQKLGPRRNIDYVAIARYMAAKFGLAPGDRTAEGQVAQLKAYNPELFERLEPQIERAEQWAEDALREGREIRTWKDLTVDEFRDLHETMEALWNTALREQQFLAAGRREDLEAVAAKVVEQNAKLPQGKDLPPGALTPGEKTAGAWNRIKQLAYRPEHWAFRKDGAEDGGMFTRYFWRPVRAAVDRFTKKRNHYTKKAADLVLKLRPSLKQGLIEFRDSNGKVLYVFGRGNGGFGHTELIGALLHTGNEGNLRRLLVGRGWGTYDPETKTLDTRTWDAFVQKMIDQKFITKEVMDFVQSVWDLNEELKPLAQKAHRDLFGYYFKEVEAVPVQTPWGTYRGGYVPAKLDASAPSAARIQNLKDLEKDFRQQFALTGRGFTMNRAANFAEPLALDINLMPSHIDDVLRFAELQPVVRDIERLAKHPDVAAALERTQPGVWQNMLLPWLQRTALQSVTKSGKSADVDNFWRAVRSSAGIATMFANVGNALQQLTGVIAASLKVGPRFLFKGLHRLLSERTSLYKEIAELSPFMANRQNHQAYESWDAIRDVTENRSKFSKLRAWVQKHGYFLQSGLQNMVDSVVWSGAFEESIAKSGKEMTDADARAEAVAAADAAVRMTQSSFEPTDVAGYQEGTPFYRVWTMFSDYFNTMANLQADTFVRAMRATGAARAGIAFQAYLLGFALPMLVADAITRTVRGQWDDDDKDGDLDVLTMDFLFLGQLRSAIAEIPVAGPALIAPAVNMLDNQPWNDRMTTSPAISLLERSLQGTVRAGKTALGLRVDRKGRQLSIEGQDIRDPLTLLGLLFGLPTGAVGSRVGYAYDLAQGTIEPGGGLGVARGLISGAAGSQARR